jgi:hypothetical protein
MLEDVLPLLQAYELDVGAVSVMELVLQSNDAALVVIVFAGAVVLLANV